MKKFLSICAIALMVSFVLTSCHSAAPNADEECVLIYKPWVFGHGGVDENPVKTGRTWCVISTDKAYFKVVPVKHKITLDDLTSNENTPLDFHTVIITQIDEGKSPILLKNYGTDWFETNIENYYCKRVREYVSRYSPFDLLSNREVLNDIDINVLNEMRAYVDSLSAQKEFPIKIKDVIIGRAIPNKKQLDEMNETARRIQAKQTEERTIEYQKARHEAERERAKADKAYREELGLSTEDFINLKLIETIQNKKDANIDVMVGSATSMWNIRR